MANAVRIFGLMLALVVLLVAPMAAQSKNYVPDAKTDSALPKSLTKEAILPDFPSGGVPFEARVRWSEEWICRSAGPAEVQGFRVQCKGASYLDFSIADCCLPGDHWQLKGKAWDVNPNTGVTTAPGAVVVYGAPGRVYNYGGTAFNPGGLDAYVECTYLNGVNVFLADSFVTFASDGTCSVTPDLVRQRIDRAP